MKLKKFKLPFAISLVVFTVLTAVFLYMALTATNPNHSNAWSDAFGAVLFFVLAGWSGYLYGIARGKFK